MEEELQPGARIPSRLLPAFTNLWSDSEVRLALQERPEKVYEDFE